MVKAKRRETSKQRQRILSAAVQMHSEGQGVWNVEIVFRRHIPAMLRSAPIDEPPPVLLVIIQAIAAMRKLQPPAMCLLCDHIFGAIAPEAFVILKAAIDGPTQAIANGLCADCASPEHNLIDRITTKYRSTLLEDLRVIPMPVEPGRA